jgi:hypothetical protein
VRGGGGGLCGGVRHYHGGGGGESKQVPRATRVASRRFAFFLERPRPDQTSARGHGRGQKKKWAAFLSFGK